jgi:hypothetical protein
MLEAGEQMKDFSMPIDLDSGYIVVLLPWYLITPWSLLCE